MIKLLNFCCCILVLSGCVSTTSVPHSSGVTSSPKTPEDWQKCANRSISVAEDECVDSGIAKELCFGAAGLGKIALVEGECGPKPSTNATLTPEMREALERHCYYNDELVGMDTQGTYAFSYQDSSGPLMTAASKECIRIYNKNALARVMEEKRKREEMAALEAEVREQNKSFSISKTYSPARGYLTAVVSTDRNRRVKCVLYDRSGSPFLVEKAVISPPVDEVLMRPGANFSAFDSVKCFSLD